MTTQLVPKRRFKGFNEIWNEKYFGEIITKLSASSESSNLPSVEYEDIIPGTGILNKDVSKKKNKKEGLLFSEGDILFGKLRPYLKNWLLADFEGIAVGDFWVFRPLEVDSNFLYFLIQTSNYQRVSNLSIGTKMPRSDWNTVSGALFGVPNQNEQQKIGEFFKLLDARIANQKRKTEKIKALKQAYLTEMFPQEGEDIPKRSFQGYQRTWIERTVEEISPLRGGHPFKSMNFQEIGIPIIRISNILSKGNIGNEFVYHKRLKSDDDFLLYSGSTVIAMSGATTGKVATLSSDKFEYFYQNQRVGYFQKVKYFDYRFISTLYKTERFRSQLSNVLVAGAQPNISSKEINSFTFKVPSDIREQQKIGEFFKTLDEKIEAEEKKLEKLKKMKAAFLEEMFV